MGASNPLNAGHAALHNYGMFHFTILNLPPRFIACLSNIHLIGIANSYIVLKSNVGINTMLGHIVHELKNLETNGFVVYIPTKDFVHVFVELAQFTADNLDFNEVFGFKTCINADYCCPLCYATKSEMQTKFFESAYELRTVAEFDKDVKTLSVNPELNSCRGVKKPCTLNKLTFYYIVLQNWLNEPMHTVHEGISPIATECVIHSLVSVKEMNLEVLNDQINWFYSLCIVERKNKPSLFNKIIKPGEGILPHLGAAEIAFFLKISSLCCATTLALKILIGNCSFYFKKL